MKRICVACILILIGGCQWPPPSIAAGPPEPTPPPSIAAAPAPPVPPAAPQIASISHEYHAAVVKELPKALAPDVAADYVSRIHEAEVRAREAVSAVERVGPKKVDARMLDNARAAVRNLSRILEESDTDE